MAEEPPCSAQTSYYAEHRILDSSPIRGRGQDGPDHNALKPRGLPTVTPKRFNKFFTPRASLSTRGGRQSKAGRQLRDITRNGANRRRSIQPLRLLGDGDENEQEPFERPIKRRKVSMDISSSPPRSSPTKCDRMLETSQTDAPLSPIASEDDALSDMLEEFDPFPKPIRRLRKTRPSHRILERSFGGHDGISQGRRGPEHCADWRSETANLVTKPTDIHRFGTRDTLPFCTAGCNTNSMIAVGEEDGSVRLLDSAASADFSKSYVHFRPHRNAVMDITFSADDYTIATASGDQTSRIIDMSTQKTTCILSGHKSSVKQVRFQPQDNNMLTTSSRDGSVQIWDLRCGSTGSVQSLRTSFARAVDNGDAEPTVRYSKYSLDVGSAFKTTRNQQAGHYADYGLSITAIQHLQGGREHLLLTSSEANSSIKLWDLRNASRRGQVGPLSSMAAPESHAKARDFGINAMVLSTDGSRVYTACRDSTIYAYSTNSLVLGHAPEMTSSAGKGRMLKEPKAGLGPLYGFRHPKFRIGTFYIKAAMRKAEGSNSEILAVGSAEHCPVIFPTDERHLPLRSLPIPTDDESNDEDEDEAELPTAPPPAIARPESNIPIFEHGTALTHGHRREVTSLCWSHSGDLVSIADDSNARCWREDAEQARYLRNCGEGGGKRWGHGWADVGEDWDEEC